MKKVYRGFLAAVTLLFLSGIATAIWIKTTPAPEGIPILAYHMVTDEPRAGTEGYNIMPEDFREQMLYLKEEGYETITPLEFMKAKKGKFTLPAKPIIISFDDGYEDNHRVALPMLEEFGMKAIIYMVTNDIGNKGYLTWEQLRDLERRGMELGSHTANHLPLTSLSSTERLEEVRLSKLLMEWNGLKTIFSLSYPNGAYDDNLPELLAQEEYLTAVTGDSGLNTFDTNPYLLYRVNVPQPHFGLTEFKLRLLRAELFTRVRNIFK